MEVRKLSLPAGLVPYSSWNSSLIKMEADSCSVICENGSVVVLTFAPDCQVKARRHLVFGSVRIGRFSQAWSDRNGLVIARDGLLYGFDHDLNQCGQMELPFYAKQMAFYDKTLVIATSNGAFIYEIDVKRNYFILKHNVYPHIPVGVAAFSPCGAWFGIAAIDGRLSFWCTEDMQQIYSVTLNSARPTSLAFSGNFAICVCKDGHVTTFRWSSTTRWAKLLEVNLRPDNVVGYLSSSFVSFWNSTQFAAILHSSYHVDVLDVSTGHFVHRLVFPSHMKFMGMSSFPQFIMLQDTHGSLYYVEWKYGRRVASLSSPSEVEIQVYSGPLGSISLRRQALRLESNSSNNHHTIPIPFVSHQLAKDLRERGNMTTAHGSNFAVHWVQEDLVCLLHGRALYRYSQGQWDSILNPTHILSSVNPIGTCLLILLGPNNVFLWQLDEMILEMLAELPVEVSTLAAKDPQYLHLTFDPERNTIEVQFDSQGSSRIVWQHGLPNVLNGEYLS
ncbi:hypothetical protein Ae201684_011542 [Aphanomyces euteiches]|uniref:Uncharacterized protein n=1 Tax=Aphanomyces euteiches TaxID=100861 RepID=A0A6G0WU51_9STRA|nr:hypothetical protein Ae201684_011542 [Aphanomyces euteiches]